MYRSVILVALTAFTVGMLIYLGPYPQDPMYHLFADTEPHWGIPNFLNVMSNLAFLFVGCWGLTKAGSGIVGQNYNKPYVIFSLGVILTTFGSGWYHLAPSNGSLIWDRLPMTISFMSLFSLILWDFVDEKWGKAIFIPALVFGIFSIGYWQTTGDLRPYIFVQFLPLLLIPVILILYFPKYGHRVSLIWALVFYGAAKGAEYFDHQMYEIFGTNLSGHSIKHILAAIGSYYVLKVFVKSQDPS